MSDEVTFRDFAGAVMGNDVDAAAGVLARLLALEPAAARAATAHFQGRMASDPDFVTKAMGMRQVVQSGDEPRLRDMLADLFALEPGAAVDRAVAAIRARYG